MSRLLISGTQLQVLPSLAVAIGLNEAIFLQQVHFWISHPRAPQREGRSWHYEKQDDWLNQFPFWPKRTLERIISNLKKQKLLIVKQMRVKARDRTNWYSIDYDLLNTLGLEQKPVDKSVDNPCITCAQKKSNTAKMADTDTAKMASSSINEIQIKEKLIAKEDKTADLERERSHQEEADKKQRYVEVSKALTKLVAQGYIEEEDFKRLREEVLYFVQDSSVPICKRGLAAALRSVRDGRWTAPSGMSVKQSTLMSLFKNK